MLYRSYLKAVFFIVISMLMVIQSSRFSAQTTSTDTIPVISASTLEQAIQSFLQMQTVRIQTADGETSFSIISQEGEWYYGTLILPSIGGTENLEFIAHRVEPQGWQIGVMRGHSDFESLENQAPFGLIPTTEHHSPTETRAVVCTSSPCIAYTEQEIFVTPVTSYNNRHAIFLGSYSTNHTTATTMTGSRGLFHFGTITLPPGGRATEVYLNLYRYAMGVYCSPWMYVRRITSGWNESTTSSPSLEGNYGDYNFQCGSAGLTRWERIGINPVLVNSYLRFANNGLAVVSTNEGFYANGVAVCARDPLSAPCNTSTRPYLEVHYVIDPPVAPSNLSASLISPSQIRLSWTDNSSDETNFRIERSLDGSTGWTEVATPTSSPHTISNVQCGQRYYFRIRAYRDGASSGYSGYSPSAAPYPNVASASCIPSPSDVTTKTRTQSSILVRWVDNSSDEHLFQIERSTDQSNWILAGTAGQNIRRFVDGGLACNTIYHYRIRAFRLSDGQYSGYASSNVGRSTGECNFAAPILVSPSNSAEILHTTSPVLVWSNVQNASNYLVRVVDQAGRLQTHQINLPNTACAGGSCQLDLSTTAITLAMNQTYTWTVRATSNLGVRFTSLPSTFAMVPYLPPTLVAPNTAITSGIGDPTYQFLPVNGATEYRIQVMNTAGAVLFTSEKFPASACTTICSYIPAAHSRDNLLMNGNYRWTARAIGPLGSSSWGHQPLAFSVDVPPPAAVNLVQPAEGATLIQSAVTFKFQTVPNAYQYSLIVTDSSGNVDVSTGFTDVSNLVCVSNTCEFPTQMLDQDTYTWRVRAFGPGGSNNRPPATFTVDVPPPGAFSLTQPLTSLQRHDPRMRWTVSQYADNYRLQLRRVGETSFMINESIPASSCNAEGCSYNLTGICFENGVNYQWRVRASNVDSVTNTPWQFIPAEVLPNTIGLRAPLDVAIYDRTPYFSFYHDQRISRYRLRVYYANQSTASATTPWLDASQICTESGGTVICGVDFDALSLSLTPPHIGQHPYRWDVMGQHNNTCTESVWSARRDFTLITTAPRVIESPMFDGNRLVWFEENSETVDTYRLVLSDAAGEVFSQTFESGAVCSGNVCTLELTSLELPTGDYAWRIISRNIYDRAVSDLGTLQNDGANLRHIPHAFDQ